MLPAIMLMKTEVDLHKRTPFRPLWFAYQMHSRFLRCPIRFQRIALNTRANNIFPGCRSTPIARNDMIEIQITAIESLPAVLAQVFIALKNIVPCELDLFLGQMVINHQQNDARHANTKGNGPD